MMKKHLAILLIVVLMFASVMPVNSFALSPSEQAVELGKAHGEEQGTEQGAEAGRSDYTAGLVANPRRSMPTDTVLIKTYELNKDLSQYQYSFLTNYKLSYDLGYYEAYRLAKLQNITKPYEFGYENGTSAGESQGVISAMMDYMLGRSTDWNRAYKSYVAEGSLESRYFLNLEAASYKARFTTGFIEGFKNSYAEMIQAKRLEDEIKNSNYKTVSMIEDTLMFDEVYINFQEGEFQEETRTPMTMNFPAGSVYEPTAFKAYKVLNSFGANRGVLDPVSSKYVISVANRSGYVELKKPVVISFEYFGSEYGGIYKWEDKRWVYQTTTLSEGVMTTEIPAGVYKGGEYAIFIDNKAKAIPTFYLSWARTEIYTLMRRGTLPVSTTFNPESTMTRAELASMIYEAQKTAYGKGGSFTIKDASNLGVYKTAIEFAVGNRFMQLDASGNFNPTALVTYKELESVLSYMLLRDVSWKEISDPMLHERYRRSSGIANVNAFATKAEIVFAFYRLLQ